MNESLTFTEGDPISITNLPWALLINMIYNKYTYYKQNTCYAEKLKIILHQQST